MSRKCKEGITSCSTDGTAPAGREEGARTHVQGQERRALTKLCSAQWYWVVKVTERMETDLELCAEWGNAWIQRQLSHFPRKYSIMLIEIGLLNLCGFCQCWGCSLNIKAIPWGFLRVTECCDALKLG